MKSPSLLGRMEDDDHIDSRSSTRIVHTVEVPFEAGAIGKVVVTVFKSQDDEDRGGVTIPRQSRGHSGCEPLKAAVRGR
jgi:hypothetical protein